MIKNLKGLLKKNRLIVGLYLLVKRHKEISFIDFFNLKKLAFITRIFPYTQLNYTRISNNYELAKEANRKKLKGCFVECGVWKGGSAAVFIKLAEDRDVWLFDSFEGMPKTRIKKDQKILKQGDNLASVEEVDNLFKKLRLNRKNVKIVKGWFNNTLPKFKDKVGEIAILRIDADFYESTKSCLDNMFDNVVKNGYVILDDYFGFIGCKKAVDEFIKKRKLKVKIIKLDNDGGFFQK